MTRIHGPIPRVSDAVTLAAPPHAVKNAVITGVTNTKTPMRGSRAVADVMTRKDGRSKGKHFGSLVIVIQGAKNKSQMRLYLLAV